MWLSAQQRHTHTHSTYIAHTHTHTNTHTTHTAHLNLDSYPYLSPSLQSGLATEGILLKKFIQMYDTIFGTKNQDATHSPSCKHSTKCSRKCVVRFAVNKLSPRQFLLSIISVFVYHHNHNHCPTGAPYSLSCHPGINTMAILVGRVSIQKYK
jgi:hypothetical protein